MAPRKKKHQGVKIHDDKPLPGRRSSLEVNLSYVSNVSDSGNESLRSIQLENDNSVAGKKQLSLHGKLLPNITENANSTASLENPGMSAMTDREQALNQSCQLLEDAIINKTREIFDGKAELTVKTATILKGKRQALKEINDDSKTVGKNRKMLSKNVTIYGPRSTIRSFPKTSNSDFRANLKHLSRISRDESLILSGSEKSRQNSLSNTRDKILRVKLTRIADQRLETSIESSQSSLSDFGAPITCSSFMSGNGNRGVVPQQAESGCRMSSDNSDVEEPGKTIETSSSSSMPMEITAVQGPLISTSKNNLKSLQTLRRVLRVQGDSSENRSSVEPMPMELTTVQNHIPFHDLTSSHKTACTSLNVNTSASVVSRTSETRKIDRTSTSFKNNNSPENDQISLRVNTSLETEKSSLTRENINNDRESERSTTKDLEKNEDSESDTDSVENMSLIARLRKISVSKLDGGDRLSTGEGPSFVEGTPYPPSRSILWRTQLRSETIRKKTAAESMFRSNQRNNLSKSSNSDSTMNVEYITPPSRANVMDDSPCRVTCNVLNPQIIKDSSEEDEPLEEASTSAIPSENLTQNVQKPGKKKLRPLCDNYEIVSFSPVSQIDSSPKKPTTWKPRKQFRKGKSTRAVAEKRIESSRRDDEDGDDVPGLLSIEGTKTRKGRAKKPRRVISKKIVVEKIVKNDLMNQIGGIGRRSSDLSNTGGRNSMNEFTQKKRFSITGRIFQSQKLVVVATGFSKGDVDLVKSIVKELGNAEMSSTVSRRTTHVVTTGVRTINLLRGIIRGCWMVSLDWVLKSLEKRKWLNAEQYEMVHFSKAVQENRRDRQIFGQSYVPELFTTCGSIYIEHGTSPPPAILKELIKTAGGRIAENPRDAKLSIGSEGLREIWILDSITTGDLQPIAGYQRKQ